METSNFLGYITLECTNIQCMKKIENLPMYVKFPEFEEFFQIHFSIRIDLYLRNREI